MTGILQIEIMDVYNGDLYGQPLSKNPFDQFSFYYTPDGGNTRLVTLELGTVNGDATYADLLNAFQKAIAAKSLNSVITAELGGSFTERCYISTYGYGQQYECDLGRYIVLKSTSATIAVKNMDNMGLPNAGWYVSTGVIPILGGIVWDMMNDNGAGNY